MKEIILSGIDEKIFYDKCDNGLPVYMIVNNKVNNFYITLNVKYGSIHNEFKLDGEEEYRKVTNGVAHFLEHVNFNEDDNTTAHQFFDKLGSSINAFTTFNFTSYEVFASTFFKENLEHLLDYVQKPYYTEKLVEKEKGIIIEEVKMGKNNSGHKLYYGMNKALFKKDRRRYLVTGEVADVKKITCEELQLVHDTFYHPENMFVVISGNFDPLEAIKIIKNNQKSKKFKKYKNPICKINKEPVSVNCNYKEIEANVEIPKVKICYKMPLSLFEGIDKELVNIYLSVILRNNFGSTSLLREELLEKQLVTGIGANRDIFNDIVVIDISCETKYPEKVIKIIKDKMKNLEITSEQVIRRRRANIAALINDFDDIEYINSEICDEIINDGKIKDNMYDIYNSLNIDGANSVLERINLDNNSTVVLVPFN
ncbi:MAG: EF-P 5-aminopentanol modification-associated protein YfmH [Candidatus Coprovivens sp.]